MVVSGCERRKNKSLLSGLLIDQDPEFSIVSLLNAAKVSVWMSSRLTPIFYNREKVRDAFIGAANRTNEFHLILDVGISLVGRKNEMPWLNELLQKGKIVAKQSKKPIRHRLLVDSNHYRMEKEHDEDFSKARSLIVWDAKEDYESAPFIAMLQSDFDSWWVNIYPNHSRKLVQPTMDEVVWTPP